MNFNSHPNQLLIAESASRNSTSTIMTTTMDKATVTHQIIEWRNGATKTHKRIKKNGTIRLNWIIYKYIIAFYFAFSKHMWTCQKTDHFILCVCVCLCECTAKFKWLVAPLYNLIFSKINFNVEKAILNICFFILTIVVINLTNEKWEKQI